MNDKIVKLSPFGAVEQLSIIPVIDFFASKPELKTEAGVSYLIKAGEKKILLDVGYNAYKEHPSPLLYNLKHLEISTDDLDMIFLSHLHLDHLGGTREQKEQQFSLSQGRVSLGEIPVYAPDNVQPSKWNPGPRVTVIQEPQVIERGLASIGVHSRKLFIIGDTREHSLAVNVRDKGIVLVIGCGHQTVERILERAAALFDEPIYGIVGGLHFPVNGGRICLGPINVQRLVGSEYPWQGPNERTVKKAISAIAAVNPGLVALSAHDSSDWSIGQFKKAFGQKFHQIEVGREIII